MSGEAGLKNCTINRSSVPSCLPIRTSDAFFALCLHSGIRRRACREYGLNSMFICVAKVPEYSFVVILPPAVLPTSNYCAECDVEYSAEFSISSC